MPIPSYRPELDTSPPKVEKTPYEKPRPGAVFVRTVGHTTKYALVRGVVENGDGSWGFVLDPGFSDCVRIASGEGWYRESDWHPFVETEPGQADLVARVVALERRLAEVVTASGVPGVATVVETNVAVALEAGPRRRRTAPTPAPTE
jgi:hypothetical protein